MIFINKLNNIKLIRRQISFSNMSATNNIIKGAIWIDLNISANELRPDKTLIIGQCFNWKELTNNNLNVHDQCWIGMLGQYPIAIRQTNESTFFANLYPLFFINNENKNINDINVEQNNFDDNTDYLIKFFHSYFQLNYNYTDLYEIWGQGCPRMKVVLNYLKGVRVIRQDPWECLISFICSSNNNIKRITTMLDNLRIKYGNYVCSIQSSTIPNNEYYQWEVIYDPSIALNLKNNLNLVKSNIKDDDDNNNNNNNKRKNDSISSEEIITKTEIIDNNINTNISLFTFPTADSLAKANEEELKLLGMGYRAKFILGTALQIQDKSEKWLLNLRDYNINDRKIVQKYLCEFPGVGKKVADCVALFSLDQTSVIPVDTHVLDIAIRDYKVSVNANKTVTPALYEEVGNAFRIRFGEYSGWAHSVLFAAELSQFSKLLPIEITNEMKSFTLERKESKLKMKEVFKKNVNKIEIETKAEIVSIEKNINIYKTRIKLEELPKNFLL